MNYKPILRHLQCCHPNLTWLRMVVLSALFSLIWSISASATASNAQDAIVKLPAQNLSFGELFSQIERQTNYLVVYSNSEINAKEKVTLSQKQGSVSQLLNEAIRNKNVKYEYSKNYIIFSNANTSTKMTWQANVSVKGTVVDEKGEPVIGASVLIKGTSKGTVTDIDGNFKLDAPKNATLVIKYIGYATQEVRYTGSPLKVVLKSNAKDLDEVVVTAFGTGQKKASIVGAVQTVRPSSLIVPSANLSNAFAGRMAGVVAYQRSGMPGSNGSDFFVRGISTISGVTSPLIILDGVEISPGDLNNIDPEVIDGFSILKDATATAMYGTRGANGVMIVTTKSGANLDKPVIGFRVEGNITTPTKRPKFVNGTRYMELFNEALASRPEDDFKPFSNDLIEGTRNSLDPYVFPNVDWYHELFRDVAFNQKANFNIRGGTNKITYFMNATVNHETGMLRPRSRDFFSYNNGINLMNYSFQNNIDFHISKTSTIALHLNVQLRDMKGPSTSLDGSPDGAVGNIYGSIMDNNPIQFPIYFPAGEEKWIRWGSSGVGNGQKVTNPLAQGTRGYSNSFASTVIANLDFEQKLDFITKGLKFKAMFSFKNWSKTTTNRMQDYNRYYVGSYSLKPEGGYDYVLKTLDNPPSKRMLSTKRLSSGDRRMYFQTYLDYNRTFGDHGVDAMVLFNLDEFNINSAGSDLISSLPRRKVGYAFRLTYNYAGRYMAEFNAGYNGSENFAQGHRFGFFPSFALGWNISEEKFWTPIRHIVSKLKLRGSYGLVGNDQIGGERFIYMADVRLQDGSMGYETGYEGHKSGTLKGPAYKRFENLDLTWEVGHKLDIGAELQLFNSLNLTVDVFREIRSNIFQQMYSIPNYLGTADSKIFGNLAKVKNWGVDMSVNYGKNFTKDFGVQFMGTFTLAKNRVLEYNEAPGKRPANSKVGHSVNAIYGYQTDHLYIDDADVANSPTSTINNYKVSAGDIKYVDQPNKEGEYDGKIDSDDMIAMGYPSIPEIVYGFGPSFRYKKWDFSFFFQGVAHTSIMINGTEPFGIEKNRNVLQFIDDDHWSPYNQNIYAKYPRLTRQENTHNNQSSDYWMRNGAFLKLKNMELGYSFKHARVYFNAINLLTFSPFKLWDPEMGGGAGMKYPTQRTFNLGIQVSFR